MPIPTVVEVGGTLCDAGPSSSGPAKSSVPSDLSTETAERDVSGIDDLAAAVVATSIEQSKPPHC